MRTDQGFVRRHKAVLRTGPLLALEASKLQRGPEWAAYELVGLALIAINAIIAHSVLAHAPRSPRCAASCATRSWPSPPTPTMRAWTRSSDVPK